MKNIFLLSYLFLLITGYLFSTGVVNWDIYKINTKFNFYSVDSENKGFYILFPDKLFRYNMSFEVIEENNYSLQPEGISDIEYGIYMESDNQKKFERYGAFYDIIKSDKNMPWSSYDLQVKQNIFSSWEKGISEKVNVLQENILNDINTNDPRAVIFFLDKEFLNYDFIINKDLIKNFFNAYYQFSKYLLKYDLIIKNIRILNSRELEIDVGVFVLKINTYEKVFIQLERLISIMEYSPVGTFKYVDVSTDKLTLIR
jgi:hypothetical protein